MYTMVCGLLIVEAEKSLSVERRLTTGVVLPVVPSPRVRIIS